MRINVKDLGKYVGQVVVLVGWVVKIRLLKTVQFLILRDNSGTVQVTNALDECAEDYFSGIITSLTPESTVEVTGLVAPNDQVKLGGVEIIPSSIKVHSLAQQPLPIQPTATMDQRLDWRFLDLRRPANLLMFRVQTLAEQAMREFWANNGFIEIHSPKLMGAASEGGAELFEVKYFDGKAYLAQSPQFYKQMAMAAGFNRVFEIGPVFRANSSHTVRHDTEFTSVDVEISWVESHEDVMQLEERLLCHMLQAVRERYGGEIKEVFGVDITVPGLPFPRVTMAEAYQILDGMGHRIERGEKGDLDPQGERLLFQHFHERTGHEFVFVTEYPAAVRAFYHMRPEGDPTTTKSFDLLWKGLEVTTGAQREHRYDHLERQAREKGVDPESIRFYLDFFRFGMPPHGGFGLGLTRILMVMLGLKNVREVTFLYRGVNRLTP